MVAPMLAMAAVETAINGLKKTMEGLKERLDAALAFADRAQQASLSLGKTYEDTKKTLGGQIEGLRGSLAQRFEAGFKTLEAGLQGNTQGVSRLINQQMLTNTAFANTARVFARLEVGLGLTRDETNNLATKLIVVGNKWEIGTDKLVTALNSLSESFPIMKLAGLGDEFAAAIAEVQGELGPELAGDLTKVLKLILDPSLEKLPTLAMLGMTNVREQLIAANNTKEQVRLIKEAAAAANSNISMLGTGAGSFFGALSVPVSLLGQDAMSFVNIFEGLGRRVEKGGDIVAAYYSTIANFKKEIWAPIEAALTALYEPLKAFWEALSVSVQTIGLGIKQWLDGFLSTGEDFIKDIKLAVLNVARTLVEIFGPIFASFGTGIAEKIKDGLKFLADGLLNFLKPGGALDSLKVAFFKAAAEFLEFADYLPGIDVEQATIDSFRGQAAIAEAMSLAGNSQFVNEIKRALDIVANPANQGMLTGKFNINQLTSQDKNFMSGSAGNIVQTLLAAGMLDEFKKVVTDPAFGSQSALVKGLSDFANKIRDPDNPNLNKTIQRFDQLIAAAEAGKILDLKFLEELIGIRQNTDPDRTTVPTFLQDTTDLLTTSMSRVLGVRPDMQAQEIIDAINNLNNTVAMQQLLARTSPSMLGRGP